MQVLIAGEVVQHLARFLEMAGHHQGAGQGDEGVSAPVLAEPGQAGPEAAAVFVDEEAECRGLGPEQGAVVAFVGGREPAAGQALMHVAAALCDHRVGAGHGAGLGQCAGCVRRECDVYGEAAGLAARLQERLASAGDFKGLIGADSRDQRAARQGHEQLLAIPARGCGAGRPHRLNAQARRLCGAHLNRQAPAAGMKNEALMAGANLQLAAIGLHRLTGLLAAAVQQLAVDKAGVILEQHLLPDQIALALAVAGRATIEVAIDTVAHDEMPLLLGLDRQSHLREQGIDAWPRVAGLRAEAAQQCCSDQQALHRAASLSNRIAWPPPGARRSCRLAPGFTSRCSITMSSRAVV